MLPLPMGEGSSQLLSTGLIKCDVFPNVTIQERGELMVGMPVRVGAIHVQNILHL